MRPKPSDVDFMVANLPVQPDSISNYDEAVSVSFELKSTGYTTSASLLPAATRSVAPSVFMMSTLTSPRWRLRLPLSVEVVCEEGQYVASSPEFDLYGVGAESWEAIESLRTELVIAIEELTAEEKNLGPALVRQLVQLRQILEPVVPGPE